MQLKMVNIDSYFKKIIIIYRFLLYDWLGHKEIVEILLNNGVDVNANNTFESTALDHVEEGIFFIELK